MKHKFFLKFFKANLLFNKPRLIIISFSLILVTATFSALLIISWGIKEKLDKELKAYGANLIITPAEYSQTISLFENYKENIYEKKYLNQKIIKKILADYKNNIENFYFILTTLAKYKNIELAISGIKFKQAKTINSWWKIAGKLPQNKKEILIDKTTAKYFNLKTGNKIILSLNHENFKLTIAGILLNNNLQNLNVFMDLNYLQQIANLKNKISLVMVKANTEKINFLTTAINKTNLNIWAKPLKQIVKASENLLKKIQILLFIVLIYVIFTAFLILSSNISLMIFERNKELALIIALGGTKKFLIILFSLGGIIMAILSGNLGFILGILISQFAAKTIFNSYFDIKIYFYLLIIFLSILIYIFSGLFTLKNLLKIKPATNLKAE